MKSGTLISWLRQFFDSIESQAYNKLGNDLMKQGDLTAAIASYKNAINLQPDIPDLHNKLGKVLTQQGDLTEAIAFYKNATVLKPDFVDAHNNLGNALMKQGDPTAAIVSYRTALELKPALPDLHYSIGLAFQAKGDLANAIDSYKAAIGFKPAFPKAYNELGNALKKQGDIVKAITSFKTAIELKPDFADAHNNLGVALECQGDLNTAKYSYITALNYKPHFPDAIFNLATLMLLNGEYPNGWKNYEWRSRRELDAGKPHALPNCKLWNGESLGADTKLLLVVEQGYGDTLQFMRYVLALQQRGIHTSLCAQPQLHSLIQASGIDASPLTPDQANQVTDGQWIPLLSLPKHLEITPENPIITEPYIHATDELNTKWKTILSAEQKPIIGINWQGNPLVEQSTLRGRSLPLQSFAPVVTQTNVKLLSLQKGFGSEQLDTCSFKEHFVSCQDQVNDTWDFHETAAIIANCDLIITSDTAIAHLAGGMGKATWLLLQKFPDWRWGLEDDTTFWYPSMLLFRQSKKDDWDEVMLRVVRELGVKYGDYSVNRFCDASETTNHQLKSTQKYSMFLFKDYRNSIFAAHCHFALEKYLNPLWEELFKRHTIIRGNITEDKLIIIADNRPSPLLRSCALNSLFMTGFKYKCFIYTDAYNYNDMSALFSDVIDFVEIKDLSSFGITKLDRDSYNELLKDSQFWAKIAAKSVLVTQQDALMIEPLPDEFFDYDYVGAPWNPNQSLSISIPEYESGKFKESRETWMNYFRVLGYRHSERIGNGGHSIRSVRYMLETCSSQTSLPDEPEDVFYARNISNYQGHFPTISEAKRFCCETAYSFSYSSHASHLYLEAHHQAEIYDRHIKQLTGLHRSILN